jgi:hypothetical protein
MWMVVKFLMVLGWVKIIHTFLKMQHDENILLIDITEGILSARLKF